MAERILHRLPRNVRDVTFERFSRSGRVRIQDHAAKAESQLDHAASDLQMFQSHGEGEHDHDPFHADALEACVLDILVNRSYLYAPCDEPGDNVTDEQDQ
jgi:hypothetical protein